MMTLKKIIAIENSSVIPGSIVDLLKKQVPVETFKIILGALKISPTAKDAEKNTLLHLAAKYNCCDIIDWLLKEKLIDINTPNDYHRPPLHLAIMENSREGCSKLLKAGADTLAFDDDGFNALDQCYDLHKTDLTHIVKTYNDLAVVNSKNRDKAEIIHELKSIGILMGLPGNIQAFEQPIRMPNGVMQVTEESYMQAFNHYLYTQDVPEKDKVILETIKDHLEFFHPLEDTLTTHYSKNRIEYINDHIKANKVTPIYTGCAGHAIYGVILNNHPLFPNKMIFIHLNRGYGIGQKHEYYSVGNWRINPAYPMDLGECSDKTLDEFLDDYKTLATLPSSEMKKIVYEKWPKKYKPIQHELFKIIMTAQKTGCCPGASLKALVKFLCVLEAEDITKGAFVFQPLNDFIKAERLIYLLGRAEDFQKQYPGEDEHLMDSIFNGFKQKISDRLTVKKDQYMFKALNALLPEIKSEHPETHKLFSELLDAAKPHLPERWFKEH